jgi:hypothetical protein
MRISRYACYAHERDYFFVCRNRNMVNLDYTNAKEEVPQLGNLIFG